MDASQNEIGINEIIMSDNNQRYILEIARIDKNRLQLGVWDIEDSKRYWALNLNELIADEFRKKGAELTKSNMGDGQFPKLPEDVKTYNVCVPEYAIAEDIWENHLEPQLLMYTITQSNQNNNIEVI